MIWNYYNITRNLFFLCFIFIIYCIFFITDAKTQSATKVCDSTNKGWDSNNNSTYGAGICTTKCSDLKVDGSYPRGNLSNGSYGHCAGSATSSPIEIYKIVLGTATGGFNGTDKCTIFNGKIVTDFAKVGKGQTVGRGELKTNSCSEQSTYDRVYFYINRIQSISGNTYFPDNSGKIARTTSACSNNGVTTVTDLSWVDVATVGGAWTDATKCYGRPTNTWDTPYIKADKTSFLTTDLTSSSDVVATFDDFKTFYLIQGGQDADGFYKESGADGDYFGVKIDPTDSNTNIYVIKNGSDLISGLPLTLNQRKKKLSLEISYYSAKRNETDTIGISFLFRRNSTAAQLVGYEAGENGLFFKFSYN
jgi:hypothetical protein